MRKGAVDARLYAFFGVIKVAAAIFAQGIKRAIAEKAVEIFSIGCAFAFVAREHLARSVLKKLVMLFFGLLSVFDYDYGHVA